MTLREIAGSGMKGRKKDYFLLKLVVSLSFAFITAALIFQASLERTKTSQREMLYGSWEGAYLDGSEDTYQKLQAENDIKDITYTRNLGSSEKLGIIGTISGKLKEMGNFSLYKGRFPEKDNEIIVELNQLSNAGMELEVGQKINLDIITVTKEPNVNQEIENKFWNVYNTKEELVKYGYHDNPSKDIADIHVVVSTDYVYLFKQGEASDPDTIKSKGYLTHQEISIQKEFTICGILNTYSDKWDLGGHKVPNAFVTEEVGNALTEAFYNNGFANVDDFKMSMDTFFKLTSLKGDTFADMAVRYPDTMTAEESLYDFYGRVWTTMKKGISDAERSKVANYYQIPQAEPSAEDTGLIKSVSEGGDTTANFRRNSFTYPDTSNSVEHLVTYGILGIIFITTVCAVFQIFLTQLKRRSRKLVLLKSIGATRSQLFAILFWEAMYLWRTGLIFGALGGTAASVAVLYVMRLAGSREFLIAIPYQLLLIGILAGTLALFTGVLLPAVSAINVPLTGTLAKKQKHSKSAVTRKGKIKSRYVKQDFYHITLTFMKNNRGKSLLSFIIALFIISILSASLYLSYNTFLKYRDSVLEVSRPDYTIKAVYGENQNKLPEIEAELKSIKGVEDVVSYKYGKNLLLWYEGIKSDPLLSTFKSMLPDKLKAEHFSKYASGTKNQPEYITGAYYSYYYGIDPKVEASKIILGAVTEGNVDPEKFNSGEEVILLVPEYKQGNVENRVDGNLISGDLPGFEQIKAAVGLDKRFHWLLEKSEAYYTSFDLRYKNLYDGKVSLKPGDTLYISADKEKVSETARIPGFNTTQVKIGGIIRYFPEEGVWPFSNLVPYYTVIGSMDGMETLYPNSKMGLFQVDIEQMTEMVKILYPTSYGRTLWNIKAEDKENQEVLDAALLTFANKYGFTLYNYRESSERVFTEAMNNILIISLLGLISSVIALIAFYNTAVSKMEQDRNRIGILQAMGVTRGQFVGQYLLQGLLQGLAAAIVTNAALFALLLTVTALTSDIPISDFSQLINQVIAERLWKYPWTLHLLVSAAFIVIITVLQMVPAVRIAKESPVDNIRSLGR